MGVKVRERKGAWWLVIDWNGRRKSRRVGVGKAGERAANAAAEKIQAKLALGDLTPLDNPRPAEAVVQPPRFTEVATEWLERHPMLRGIRPNTLANYQSFTRHHLVPFFGTTPVAKITPEMVENFIAAKLSPNGSTRHPGKPLSRGSLRIGLVALRLILDRAVKAGWLTRNPVIGLSRFPRVDEERIDPFTTPELQALLETAQRIAPDMATLLCVWAQTGMRAGEVCGLQWQDVDLEKGTVLVRRTWSRGRIGPPKTGHSRVVSLLHPVPDNTAEWRPGATPGTWAAAEGLRRLRIPDVPPDGFIFARGDGPIRSYALHQSWRRILGAAGVRYRAPEQLRHTFASTMLSRNAPLLYVQKQGGWRSAAVLLRVYSRWLPPEEPVTVRPSATPAQPDPAALVQA